MKPLSMIILKLVDGFEVNKFKSNRQEPATRLR